MDDALKTRGIKYLNEETWLLFAPLSKYLATRLTQCLQVKIATSRILSKILNMLKCSFAAKQVFRI